LYAGAIAVPLPFNAGRRGAVRLAGMAATSQAAVVLTTETSAKRIADLLPAALQNVPLIAIDRLDTPYHCGPAAVAPDAAALVQYSSGATSDPKGVVITHAALMANLEMMREAGQVDPHSVYVSWLPLFHDMGLIGVALEALYAGARAVIMPPIAFLQRPDRWLEAIDRYRGTIAGAPNFAYDLCVRRFRAKAEPALDLSSWSMAFCGAEPIRAQTLRRFADLFTPYGFRASALYPEVFIYEACRSLIRFNDFSIGLFGYWTRIGSRLSSLKAASWSGVGLEWRVKRWVRRDDTRMVLRTSVAR
jgi:acyl-CoA synthetase (AMP-forming)/AMP-acid ligase II